MRIFFHSYEDGVKVFERSGTLVAGDCGSEWLGVGSSQQVLLDVVELQSKDLSRFFDNKVQIASKGYSRVRVKWG